MVKGQRSRIKEECLEAAYDLYEAGVIDKARLREYQELCGEATAHAGEVAKPCRPRPGLGQPGRLAAEGLM